MAKLEVRQAVALEALAQEQVEWTLDLVLLKLNHQRIRRVIPQRPQAQKKQVLHQRPNRIVSRSAELHLQRNQHVARPHRNRASKAVSRLNALNHLRALRRAQQLLPKIELKVQLGHLPHRLLRIASK